MKELLIEKLTAYDYNFVEKDNILIVKIGYSLVVNIDLSKEGKCSMTDRLNGPNALTGFMKMSLNHVMIYNTILFLIATPLFMYLSETDFFNSYNMIPVFIMVAVWVIIWTNYYLTKSETFKNKVITWIER